MKELKVKVWNKRRGTYPPGAVYVGRPTVWGNPYSVDVYGRMRAVELYESYLLNNITLIERAQRELRGKHLVCWCAPQPCHADFLLRIANS